MSFVKGLQCRECGRQYPVKLLAGCEHCFGLKRAEAMFTAGKQLDWILASAFPALETLDEAHERTFLLSTASTRGKTKKPRAKLARGFHQPFRSCLAVFYVEQVA